MTYLQSNNNNIEEYLLPVTGICFFGLVIAAYGANKVVGYEHGVNHTNTHFKFFYNLINPNADRLAVLENNIKDLRKLEVSAQVESELLELEIKCNELEKKYSCPIGQFIMSDPVTMSSGITFEKNEIAKWLAKAKEQRRCPVTRKILIEKKLPETNRIIKNNIQEKISKYETMFKKIKCQFENRCEQVASRHRA
ncbi:MAG: hypothetical protein P4M12_07185 [Gammaproteobacteria bacterium]|nr:hypothetical protein [Gammaproteobacteria bacterium]